MKKQLLLIVLMLLPLMASAHDIEVRNGDGVTIYYNYTNDGMELEVTSCDNNENTYKGNVVIPDEVSYMNRTRKVTRIGRSAFEYCNSLTSVIIPNSVVYIGERAFFYCKKLTSISIPNSVRRIESGAFQNCNSLKKVVVSDIAAWCSISFVDNPLFYANHLYSDENTEIKDLVIPNSVTSIGQYAFSGCSSLTSVTMGNNVRSIGYGAFESCDSLKRVIVTDIAAWCAVEFGGYSANPLLYARHIYSDENMEIKDLVIPNGVRSIGVGAFCGCLSFTSITIPNSVTSIGKGAFNVADILTVNSYIDNPSVIYGKASEEWDRTFSLNTFSNATLYVPKGSIEKYKTKKGWKDFVFIEENDKLPTLEKCEKPTIIYRNGNLMFTSSTEGATCYYSIIDTDIKTGSGSEVQLTATYNISVYAAKEGFENSETATATLCWIDDVPQMEGITNSLTRIAARPILVRTDNGFVTVEGIDDRTDVSVFAADGKLAGTAVSHSNIATIATSIQSGSIAIVKVGEKSMKVVMK